MILKNKLYYLAIIFLLTSQLWAANTNPVVTNVAFTISGGTVTVTYNVADAEENTVTISMEVSSDNGTTWNYNYVTASGDIGTLVNAQDGLTKSIIWTYSGGYNDQFKIRIIANDLVIDGGPCVDPTLTYSGETYNTVQIGNQCWLKENLNIGTRIDSRVGSDANYQKDNSIIEKYCYNNLESNCATYGGLYQWAEAVQYLNGATNTTSPSPAFSGNVQGICPTGWHIPTVGEYTTLQLAVGSNGNSLKEVGQGTEESGAGTNTSGFSALLAGYCNNVGLFMTLLNYTRFWSSTEYSADKVFYSLLDGSTSNIVVTNNQTKVYGHSIRCLKD
ncbi:MAG: hypothetical protein NTX22_03475 [Ignavibacteriales bacterium]|nr:hypothetical protein [Ignavibacteriales bacterium]